jgi:uncharacterized protein (TIGR02145 family)
MSTYDNYIITVLVTPEGEAFSYAQFAKTAQTAAETAQGLAEDARDTAVIARNALQPILDDLANLLAVRDDLPEINAVYAKLTEISVVYADLANIDIVAGDTIQLNAVYNALTELLAIHAQLAKLIELHTELPELLALHLQLSKLTSLYDNLTGLVAIYDNLAAILNLNSNLAHVTTVEAALANITIVSNAIANVNTVADNVDDVNTVAGDLALGASSKTKIVAENIADVNTAADNIAAIQAAPTHATTATEQAGIATDKAAEASGHADDAETAQTAAQTARDKSADWAEEDEDVEVETGQYSAKHHALKAADSETNAAASAAEAAGYAGYPLNFIDDSVITLSERSITDGAVILRKLRHLQSLIDDLSDAGIRTDKIELFWLSDNPAIVRTDGILKYYREGLDAFNTNDLDGSKTASLQPRLVGGIAPNSKVAAANLNGESRYFTHPEIKFEADEAWSMTLVFEWDGKTGSSIRLLGDDENLLSNLFLAIGNENDIKIRNANGSLVLLKSSFFDYAKKITLTVTSSGSNELKSYINGNIERTNSYSTDGGFVFKELFRSFHNYSNVKISAYHIASVALTPEQVAAEHALLSSLYPEIESVEIGSKTVASRNFEAVASLNGTVIPNLTTQAAWSAGTSGWSYHNGATPDTPNPDNGAIYGKLYNKAARDVIIANPPEGWHVATEAELTALAALGGNALKYTGTSYWSTTGGTNTTGFTALGGSSRNADGTFNTIKETASFWCADSDKVLLLNHADNTATIASAAANEGHSIRLVKD